MPSIAYTTARMSPLDLTLDIQNPRFLNLQPTQKNCILYLLEHAKVINLARNIIAVGGLFPGERIVVFRNDQSQYIVLEGNRRVCACQLLLNRNLIPASKVNIFPEITDSVRTSITEIDVDIIDSREEARSFLTSRHIGGIERWDSIAKWKFFEEKFARGESLDAISASDNYPKNEIKDDIQNYYLFFKAYSLNCWTEEQKKNELNLFTIEANKFIRIFNTRGAKGAFKLSFNSQTLQPESALPPEVFDAILERIMYCAYITSNESEKIDTRDKWNDVSGIQEILARANPQSSPQSTPQQNAQTASQSQPQAQSRSVTPTPAPVGQSQTTAVTATPVASNQRAQVPELRFFESLTWSGVDTQTLENQGLLIIAEEIRKISTNGVYRSIPVSATVLLRSLLEQTLKYLLRKSDPQGLQTLIANNRNGDDPSLSSIIKYYTTNDKYKTLIPQSRMQKVFNSQLGNMSKNSLKDFLDLAVHHPGLARPNTQELVRRSQPIYPLIDYILNLP